MTLWWMLPLVSIDVRSVVLSQCVVSTSQHVDAAITLLKKKYCGWRAVLDDGNSFYRAAFLGFLEHCVQSNDGDAVITLCERSVDVPID